MAAATRWAGRIRSASGDASEEPVGLGTTAADGLALPSSGPGLSGSKLDAIMAAATRTTAVSRIWSSRRGLRGGVVGGTARLRSAGRRAAPTGASGASGYGSSGCRRPCPRQSTVERRRAHSAAVMCDASVARTHRLKAVTGRNGVTRAFIRCKLHVDIGCRPDPSCAHRGPSAASTVTHRPLARRFAIRSSHVLRRPGRKEHHAAGRDRRPMDVSNDPQSQAGRHRPGHHRPPPEHPPRPCRRRDGLHPHVALGSPCETRQRHPVGQHEGRR